MKASDLFVKCLENEGVEYIFGIPGEENLDMLNSMKDSNIKLILTRNEQTAVFMAATYGRFTGKPGVALATLGPGATNMVTGVGYAQLNGYPVIVITGQKPIKKSKQGDFQVIDVLSMMKPVTKEAIAVHDPNKITSQVRHAFDLAQTERPGAVHMELPEDIASEEAQECELITPTEITQSKADSSLIDALVEKLENAQTPVVLIGAGASRNQVGGELRKFVEKYNIPFFESQMGKGVVDERLSQYIGTAALSDGDGVHRAVEHADLILALGHDVIEKPTNFLRERQEFVHINNYEYRKEGLYYPTLSVIGDIEHVFENLNSRELDTANWNFEKVYETRAKETDSMTASESKEQGSEVMMPRRFVRELRELMSEQDILALDNGWYKIWIARNYPAYHPNTVMLDNTFATMGAGLPTGMMAKFLNPDSNVVVVTGDGGLVMNLGDLETAVRLGNNMIILVLNNNAYGMIKVKQAHAGFPDFGLDLPNPDFIQLAESFGAIGMRVESPDDFTPTMEKALNTSGVTVVELPFHYPLEVD